MDAVDGTDAATGPPCRAPAWYRSLVWNVSSLAQKVSIAQPDYLVCDISRLETTRAVLSSAPSSSGRDSKRITRQRTRTFENILLAHGRGRLHRVDGLARLDVDKAHAVRVGD